MSNCQETTSKDLIVRQDEFIGITGKHAKEHRCANLCGDGVVADNVGHNVEGVHSIVDIVEATRVVCGPQQRSSSCSDGGEAFRTRWHDCINPQQNEAILTQTAALEI